MAEINKEKEFDNFVEDYKTLHQKSVKLSGYDTSYFDEMKIKEVSDFLRKKNKQPKSILNFGCGIGKSEPYFRSYFPDAKILGIDVSTKSVTHAKGIHRELENVAFMPYDGQTLPTNEKFDLIFAANVFHHIPFSEHDHCFTLIKNALSEKGSFFLFEHNPYNPLTLKAVKDCEFDADAVLLSPRYSQKKLSEIGFSSLTRHFILFIPFFLRFLQPIEKYLKFLPMGAQYFYYSEKGNK